MNPYPIGIQTFSEILKRGCIYVDKTRFIPELRKEGKYIFLSRPRRFGKSLMLSTLEAYFEGRRELFKGLAIDNMDVDWTPRPVLYLDLNTGWYDQPTGLRDSLSSSVARYERIYGIPPQTDSDPAVRFGNLIEHIHKKTGQKAVILFDEYDKPLLAVEEDGEQYEKNQTLLKAFYSNLKTMDRHIEFTMLTGVSRFSKVSIFSDLNNLKDISMYDRYQEICGWTEAELASNFRAGIENLAKKRKETPEQTLTELRNYYDGYLFCGEGNRLYNPFSVMMALDSEKILPYWFGTGTPTFLVKRVRAQGTYPPAINGTLCSSNELMSVGMNDSNPLPLMFQTGYLTIDRYVEEMDMYALRFPNREVEISFYEDLLKVYVPQSGSPDSPFNFKLFKLDLVSGQPDVFMQRLSTLLKDLPGEDHNESTYRAVTYLLAVLSGVGAIAEHHGYKGRSDIEVATRSYIYVFEFKYNKSVNEAMEQIHSRDYAGRYAMDSRTAYLIGANFIENKECRKLEYEIKSLWQL